jgi:acetylornithine/N-succinyldiaminopimelate aminotransferase
LTIDSGKGCFLKTTDGKSYLDCVSGIATCALGHNNEYLTKAIENQMKKVHHVSNLYFIPEQAALANWLCENSGADKAFFCNSGAEANEAAIKLARRFAYNRGIQVRVWLSVWISYSCRDFLRPPLDEAMLRFRGYTDVR